MPPLHDRVVAITGASAGIGRATALAAARAGAHVALFARRASRLQDVADQIGSAGRQAVPITGDVTDEDDVRRFIASVCDRFGHLDALVCSAGIGYHGALDATPSDAMRRVIDTNLMGTLYACRAALEVFRRQNSGHLIAVSSIVGRRGISGASAYAASKFGQVGVIESLRSEFVGSALRASVICPVSVDTEFRKAQKRDFGLHVEGHGPKQTPDQVATRIVECLVSPRAEVHPYRLSRLLAILGVVAPAATDRIVQRFGRRVVPKLHNDGHVS